MIESRVNLAVQALATMAPPTKTPRAAWIEGACTGRGRWT